MLSVKKRYAEMAKNFDLVCSSKFTTREVMSDTFMAIFLIQEEKRFVCACEKEDYDSKYHFQLIVSGKF